MSGKNKHFDGKKIKKTDFYKNKKINRIDEFLKKNYTAQRIHLNTLLGMMIMMLLDHYV